MWYVVYLMALQVVEEIVSAMSVACAIDGYFDSGATCHSELD
jgi:hypothetical protein